METLVKEQTTRKGQLVDIGKGIKAGIVNITPEQAEKMLGHNHNNRGIKKAKISQYAIDMEEGLWQMNGVPLVFNHNGDLLDGQNRLHAIIRSGISCEMLVVSGIERKAFQTIDTGSNRSGADVLTIIGVPSEKAQNLSSLIGRIYKENTGKTGHAWSEKPSVGYPANHFIRSRAGLTNQLIVDYYKKHQVELDEVYGFCSQFTRKVKKIMPTSMYLLGFYKLRKINVMQAEDFFAKLATGDMLSSEDPVYHLREKLIVLKTSETDKAPGWHYAAYIYKAWNAQRKGNKMQRLFLRQTETEPVKPI